MKTPRNLAFILGLSVAACSSNIIPVDKPIETPQIEEVAPECFPFLDCYSEPIVEEESVCFPLNDCTSPYNVTIQEPPKKQTIEDLVDKKYKETVNTEDKRIYVRNTLTRINEHEYYFERYSKRYSKKYGCNIEKNLVKAIAYVETQGKHRGMVTVKNKHGRIILKKRPGVTTRSIAGALGIMQLTPPTAKDWGVNPHVLWQNIKGGSDLIGFNLEFYDQNVPLALNAYNAGRKTMRYITRKAGSNDFMIYREETRTEAVKEYPIKVFAVKKHLDGLDACMWQFF